MTQPGAEPQQKRGIKHAPATRTQCWRIALIDGFTLCVQLPTIFQKAKFVP